MLYFIQLSTNRGVALVTVILCIMVMSMLSATLLNLLVNQNKAIEHNINRIQAIVATESVFVRGADYMNVRDGDYSNIVPFDIFNWFCVTTKQVNIAPWRDADDNTALNLTVNASVGE